jgi:hypothetical protein
MHPIVREREVASFAQDDTGVEVEPSDGQSLRADYLVGCDEGRQCGPKGGRHRVPRGGSVDQLADQRGRDGRGAGARHPPGAACPISTWSPPTARFACSPCCTTPGLCCRTSVSPGFDIMPWAARVNVAWVGDGTDLGLHDALATWFGPPVCPKQPNDDRKASFLYNTLSERQSESS